MTETVESKPEFHSLAEDAVVAALQDLDPSNPIAIEVVRLISGYTRNVQAQVRLGVIPSDVLYMKPRLPIEAVAMRLITEIIRETLAQPTPPEQT